MAERRLRIEAREIEGEKIIPDANPPRVFASHRDLTPGEKDQLKDLVIFVKSCHSPGKAVTSAEIKEFIQLLFARGWTSKKSSKAPDYDVIRPKLRLTAVAVGKLSRDIPPASLTKAAGGKRAIKNRVHKQSISDSPQPLAERRHGAEILMRCLPNAQGGLTFQFVDTRARLIPEPDIYCNFHNGYNMMTARRDAVLAFDEFEFTTVHNFNVDLAVHYARTRLILWGNLGSSTGVPEGQKREAEVSGGQNKEAKVPGGQKKEAFVPLRDLAANASADEHGTL